jgi:plasmid stability protein
MMVRTQITLESELQRKARRRASDMGVSLAEYVRRLVTRDLASPEQKPDVSCIFDLGSSDGSDIAANKDAMIAEAFLSFHNKDSR